MQIIPGYKYKDGSPVTAQIGSEKVAFFSRDNGGTGSAWVKDPADEARLADAMRRSVQVVITGRLAARNDDARHLFAGRHRPGAGSHPRRLRDVMRGRGIVYKQDNE